MSEVKVYWIAPDEPDGDDDIRIGDALSEHPNQGPLEWQASLFPVVKKTALDAALARVKELEGALDDAISELSGYSMARRDQSFEGWEREWREIPIKHESDYEFYPNHVDKETIAHLKKALRPETTDK